MLLISYIVDQKFFHSFPSLGHPTRTYAHPLSPVPPNTSYSLGVALVDPTLDLLKETPVGVPGRWVFLTLQDLGVADGQLPAGTLALVLDKT